MKSTVPCPVAVASLTALLAACSSGLPATQGGRDATPITDAQVIIDTADTSIDGQQCVSTVEQHPEWGPRIVKGAWWRSQVNLAFFEALRQELVEARAA